MPAVNYSIQFALCQNKVIYTLVVFFFLSNKIQQYINGTRQYSKYRSSDLISITK